MNGNGIMIVMEFDEDVEQLTSSFIEELVPGQVLF